jgi:CheY-like chemotaxis protein
MPPKTENGCVLVVEDPLIQKFVRSVLKQEGHQVVEARSDESLRMLRARDLAVNLLITNQPKRFLEFAETLPLIYLAATPDPALASRFRRCRILRKPFPPGDLVACVAELAQAKQA